MIFEISEQFNYELSIWLTKNTIFITIAFPRHI